MKQLNLPLNQHKTITTRKKKKLRKIKKRKTKASKTPIANNDHDIKREEDLIKKNQSNSGIKSIQQIKQRLGLLRAELKKYINGSENPTNNGTNIHSCKICPKCRNEL